MNLIFQESSLSDRIEDTITESATLDQLALNFQHTLQSALHTLPPAVVAALRGDWLGHPVHPIKVHLPLGGWMIAALLDFAPLGNTPEKRQQYQKAADTALLLGTVGGAGAVATGWVEWSTARGQARRTGLIHGALNETAFLLNVGSLIARKKGRRGLGKALSGAGLGVALAGGMLGGQLVYRHRMG